MYPDCREKLKKHILPILSFICIGIIVLFVLMYLNSTSSPDHFVPVHLRHFLRFERELQTRGTNLSADTLREITERHNSLCEVLNWRSHGVVRAHTSVLCVLVARDLPRLQYLVAALAQVRDVHKVLLVFSHSYYHDKINQLVRNIRFCRVMQLFYPHSLQLNPDRFPGVDPDDCNPHAPHPPCEGRDAHTTERKHHWWWTTHFLFEQLPWSARSTSSFVIYLQEDDYVAPDLLHVFRYLQRARESYIKEADVLSLGRTYASGLDYGALVVDAWRPPYDRGLVLDRRAWTHIMNEAKFFCMYNDSSWSYSLLHQFWQTAPRGRLRMVASEAPRVLSTRSWGDAQRGAEAAWREFSQAPLFPERMHAIYDMTWAGATEHVRAPPPRGDGGFKDVRDHLLCLKPTLTTATKDDATIITNTSTDTNCTSTTLVVVTTDYLDY